MNHNFYRLLMNHNFYRLLLSIRQYLDSYGLVYIIDYEEECIIITPEPLQGRYYHYFPCSFFGIRDDGMEFNSIVSIVNDINRQLEQIAHFNASSMN